MKEVDTLEQIRMFTADMRWHELQFCNGSALKNDQYGKRFYTILPKYIPCCPAWLKGSFDLRRYRSILLRYFKLPVSAVYIGSEGMHDSKGLQGFQN